MDFSEYHCTVCDTALYLRLPPREFVRFCPFCGSKAIVPVRPEAAPSKAPATEASSTEMAWASRPPMDSDTLGRLQTLRLALQLKFWSLIILVGVTLVLAVCIGIPMATQRFQEPGRTVLWIGVQCLEAAIFGRWLAQFGAYAKLLRIQQAGSKGKTLMQILLVVAVVNLAWGITVHLVANMSVVFATRHAGLLVFITTLSWYLEWLLFVVFLRSQTASMGQPGMPRSLNELVALSLFWLAAFLIFSAAEFLQHYLWNNPWLGTAWSIGFGFVAFLGLVMMLLYLGILHVAIRDLRHRIRDEDEPVSTEAVEEEERYGFR
jgi:hypothetical protein